MDSVEDSGALSSEVSFGRLEARRQGVVLRNSNLSVVRRNAAARQILEITTGTEIEPQAPRTRYILGFSADVLEQKTSQEMTTRPTSPRTSRSWTI